MKPDDAAGLVADLLTSAQNVRDAQRQLDRNVAEARQRGLPWSKVGEALGVSKQAAQKKYRSTRVALDDQQLPEETH